MNPYIAEPSEEAGPKLDRRIAEEVMDWWEEDEGYWRDIDGEIAAISECSDWRPSLTMNDAYQVIQKMMELGYSYSAHSLGDSKHLRGNKHVFEFMDLRDLDPMIVNGVGHVTGPKVRVKDSELFFPAKAPTLPLAVCRAALLTLRLDKKNP